MIRPAAANVDGASRRLIFETRDLVCRGICFCD
jgi:hypothetical protein